jgi:hypothetical protein
MDPTYHNFNSKNSVHSIIHTREKLGTTSKRLLKYFADRSNQIIKI